MVWQLSIPHGTQEDYDFFQSNLERAWFDVNVDMDGNVWVDSPVAVASTVSTHYTERILRSAVQTLVLLLIVTTYIKVI